MVEDPAPVVAPERAVFRTAAGVDERRQRGIPASGKGGIAVPWGAKVTLAVQTKAVVGDTFHYMPTALHETTDMSATSLLEPVPERLQGFVDAERSHIARELHDIVAYSFATISVQAGVAAHVADDRPEQAAEALRAIQEISGQASRELRAVLGVMRTAKRPETPVLGLALLDSLAATTTSAGLSTRVVVQGEARSLPSTVDRAAYRIAQEALTNALRHAGPASAVVTVRYEPDRLVLEVCDDGRGPVQTRGNLDPGSGHGINGMRERALALGGQFDAGPHSSGGFRVHASLPVGVQS
jgi:signal transduction histidine kinase